MLDRHRHHATRPGVEQHPAAGVGAEQDGIPLPDVQHVQLDAMRPGKRDRWKYRHCGECCESRDRWPRWEAAHTRKDERRRCQRAQ